MLKLHGEMMVVVGGGCFPLSAPGFVMPANFAPMRPLLCALVMGER